MYIEAIEINHFKSFAGTTQIPFKPGFTTISGPNGSGKSNIIDAVLFCLGLSTSRTLRAEKLGDLISNISPRREASVVITFRLTEADKEAAKQLAVAEAGEAGPDNAEPIEEPADTMTIGRRIREVSKGNFVSTYSLNGRNKTLGEVHAALDRFHISPGCYNVMMQGDVAGIVNMGGVERRKIIDELAGVAEFDRKITQAQMELATTGQTIDHHNILLEEITQRLAELAGEREQALKYQALQQELAGHERELVIADYMDVIKAESLTRENLAETLTQIEAQGKAQAEANEKLITLQTELDKLETAVHEKGEDEQLALYRQIEAHKATIAGKEESIALLESQQRDTVAQRQALAETIQNQQDTIAALEAEDALLADQLTEAVGLLKQETQRQEATQKELEAASSGADETLAARQRQRQAVEQLEDARADISRQRLDDAAERERLARLIEETEARQSAAGQKRSTLNQLLTEQRQQLDSANTAMEGNRARLLEAQRELDETRQAVSSRQEQLQQLQRTVIQLESRKQAMDEVSFSRAVETVLGARIKGVHGTLAQLASVPPEYAHSLEIAMGGRIQNLVVDNERVAEAGIRMLQENRGGRATFLPLTQLRQQGNLPPLPRKAGVVDFALNLIGYDARYEAAFRYALGDTLVVEDIEAAKPLLRQYRMVTLDGSLMEKSGAMTGGASSHQRPKNVFGGQTDVIGAEITEARKRLETAQGELETLLNGLDRLESEREQLKNALSDGQQNRHRLELQLNTLTTQLESLADETPAPDQADAMAAERTRLATLDAALANADAKLAGLDAELDAERTALAKLDAQGADPLETLRKALDDARYQRDYYDTQRRNLENDRKGKAMERDFAQKAIDDAKARDTELEAKLAGWARKIRDTREEIGLLLGEIDRLQKQTKEIDEELRALQQQRDAARHNVLEHEKSLARLERQIASLHEQRAALEARQQELSETRREKRWALAEAGQDLDELDARQPEDVAPRDKIDAAIRRVTGKMRALEPVNMRALQTYDEVDARRAQLAEKLETLTSEVKAINARISGYESLKREAFGKSFETVDANFRTIFAELSDGSGQLILTNPDNPFEGGLTIQASPRGKKTQRLEAMSGGEKSLTSLAFIFALQRTQPAPFYALDEVDMNLDGINAEKLASMVGREAENAQFIVVSLRKPMIEKAARTIGVTQRRTGSSKVVGVEWDPTTVLGPEAEDKTSEEAATA